MTQMFAVYLNSLKDCFLKEPVPVTGPVHVVSQSNNPYDMLRCNVTFQSRPGTSLCVTFTAWDVQNCALHLHVRAVALSVLSQKEALGLIFYIDYLSTSYFGEHNIFVYA